MDDFNQKPNYTSSSGAPSGEEMAPVLSTKEYLLMFLPWLIPCVGLILFLVWSFSGTSNPNRRNCCRGYLLYLLIGVAIATIFYLLVGAIFMAAFMSI